MRAISAAHSLRSEGEVLRSLEVGLRVRRGPDWSWDDQDQGGLGTTIEAAEEDDCFKRVCLLLLFFCLLMMLFFVDVVLCSCSLLMLFFLDVCCCLFVVVFGCFR